MDSGRFIHEAGECFVLGPFVQKFYPLQNSLVEIAFKTILSNSSDLKMNFAPIKHPLKVNTHLGFLCPPGILAGHAEKQADSSHGD